MASVLCIGISVLDYVFQVDDMPVRAEKYRSKAMKTVGGGIAANAAVAVARQGGTAHLITRLGDDALGRTILDELAQEGVNCSLSLRATGLKSPLSCILVDKHGERMIISYSDPAMPEETSWLPDRLPAGVNCVLGDTRWQAGSSHIFALARQAGIPAVLDGDRKPADETLLDQCSHAALSAQACLEITGERDARAGLEVLRRKHAGWLAITDGGRGVYWTHGSTINHTPAFSVNVIDTLGAGDTWHGAFALGLAEGMVEEKAVRYASAVSAIKCTRFGGRGGIPERAEVDQFLKENP
jgi:sulfofructose kinase